MAFGGDRQFMEWRNVDSDSSEDERREPQPEYVYDLSEGESEGSADSQSPSAPHSVYWNRANFPYNNVNVQIFPPDAALCQCYDCLNCPECQYSTPWQRGMNFPPQYIQLCNCWECTNALYGQQPFVNIDLMDPQPLQNFHNLHLESGFSQFVRQPRGIMGYLQEEYGVRTYTIIVSTLLLGLLANGVFTFFWGS